MQRVDSDVIGNRQLQRCYDYGGKPGEKRTGQRRRRVDRTAEWHDRQDREARRLLRRHTQYATAVRSSRGLVTIVRKRAISPGTDYAY